MKSLLADTVLSGSVLAAEPGPALDLLRASSDGLPELAGTLLRARNFAEPLIAHETLDTGENIMAHADAVAAFVLND